MDERLHVDPQTVRIFNEAVTAAKRKGTPLIDELARRDILNTQRAEKDLVTDRLMGLVSALDAMGPVEIMRGQYSRPHGTPTEMFNAIMDFACRWVSIQAGKPVTRS